MRKIIFLLTISILFSNINHAQKKAFTIADLYKIKSISMPVISENNSRMLFSITKYDLPKNKSNTDIYISNLNGKKLRKLTNSKSANYNPIWCNNKNGFYFVSYRSGSAQVYYLSLNGGEAEQITNFYPGVSSPKLSPNGKYLIFTAKVFPECGADENCNKKITDAMQNGPIQAHLADSLFVRHWTEYNDGKYSHIFLYDIQNKVYKDLTPGYYNSPTFAPGGSDDYEFSPDSKKIIFSSKRVNNPEASTNSDIWEVSIDGSNLKNLTKENTAYDGNAKFSPDGKFIAYLTQKISGYESDKWRLAILDVTGKKSTILTEKIDNNVGQFVWASNSKSLYFSIDEKGYNPILKVDIDTKKINYILKGKSLHGFTVTNDDKNIIYKFSFVHQPAEIGKYNLITKEDKQITAINKAFTDTVDVRKAEEIWITGSEGKKIQVFLVKPHNFNPAKKYPFIINVHGGPQMQWRNSFRGDWQVYPGAGYVLAFPNPHGSTGFGKDFTRDISTGWDGNVYKDVMMVMDSLQNLPYVDKNRMGAMGWSYGGYFMNLLQARGNRFKCLASMMSILDLKEFYLGTEELWFPNFDLNGPPWKNKELYKKQSPSNFINNFKTPTLIITGEKDYRIPYTHSLEYFTALQLKGIPSRLIIFKNDGHWPSYFHSMPLYYNAHLEWFHKYLGGAPAPWNSKEMVRNLIFN